jgi:hypothetical protein
MLKGNPDDWLATPTSRGMNATCPAAAADVPARRLPGRCCLVPCHAFTGGMHGWRWRREEVKREREKERESERVRVRERERKRERERVRVRVRERERHCRYN